MKKLSLFILSSILALGTTAQKQDVTLGDIWQDPKFYPQGIDELQSTVDGNHYTSIKNGDKGECLVKYDYATGNPTDTLLTSDNMMIRLM